MYTVIIVQAHFAVVQLFCSTANAWMMTPVILYPHPIPLSQPTVIPKPRPMNVDNAGTPLA